MTNEITRSSGGSFSPSDGFFENVGDHVTRYLWASNCAIGKDAIDIGCGHGYCSDDEDPIEFARTNYHQQNLDFVRADVENNFPVEQLYDLVICFEVLENLNDAEKFVRNCRQILRTNGQILLSTPNRLYSIELFGKLSSPLHVKEFEAKELSDLFGRHDFVRTLYKEYDSKFNSITIRYAHRAENRLIPESVRRTLPQRIRNWYMRKIMSYPSNDIDSRGRYHDFVITDLKSLLETSFPTLVVRATR